MYALLALGSLALIFCLLFTPLCRDAALALGWVDVPNEARKIHTRPIPRVGGIAIAISYVGALAVMLALAPSKASISIQHKHLLWTIGPAVAIMFLTGLVDDLITLKPWQKLSGQAVAAALAVFGGARINLLDGHPHNAWLTIPLSFLWLLVCTNAFNLIDGLDGLASGIGLLATATVLLAALIQGNWGLAMATVPLLGCLLGFLRYNFNPASVFLGDCGSLTIGFMLGCFGVIWSQKSATFLGLLAPAMALALPLFDVLLSIGRRFLRDKPIFGADAGHIHHRLLKHGFHPRTVAFILYGVCGIAAVLSLLQSSFGYHLGGIVVIMFCVLAFFGIKRLEYIEFATAKRVLTGTRVLDLVRQEIFMAHLREELALADDPEALWSVVRDACRNLAFTSVQFTIGDQVFEEVLQVTTAPDWQLSMSLGKNAGILLTRQLHESSHMLMTSFCRVLHDCIQSKRYMESDALVHARAHAAA